MLSVRTVALASVVLVVGAGCPENPQVTKLQDELDTLSATCADQQETLDLLTKYIKVSETSPLVIIEGANLMVTNGSGASDTNNPSAPGTGNVIIGYNEGSGSKTGYHNLVVGAQHSYTSFAGVVTGHSHTLNGGGGAIIGGHGALVDADYAVVVGGLGGQALGQDSVVVGGGVNVAGGDSAVVVGGQYGSACGSYSVVVGGERLDNHGPYGLMLGGTGGTGIADCTGPSDAACDIPGEQYYGVSLDCPGE